MQFIALNLRRSGSTAFWNVFNSNPNYYALDEPFNPKLSLLPEMHPKETWDRFIDIYNKSPYKFKNIFSPINKQDQLNDSLPIESIDYLKYLLNGHENWFFDTSRCHLKIDRLSAEFPSAKIIHLYRNPIGFVSSHIIPSYGRLRAKRDRFLNKYAIIFWMRRGGYNTWSIETLYNKYFDQTYKWFEYCGIPAEAKEVKLAHEKLLLYWLFHYRYLEKKSQQYAGSRCFKICFDDFCENPTPYLSDLFDGSVKFVNEFGTSHLRSVNSGFKPGHKNWAFAMKKVGFTKLEISKWL